MIAERFNKTLSFFLKASNSKVNIKKSKVYDWNFPPRTLVRIVRILGFEGKINWNSFSYLGSPIFKGKKNSIDWQGVGRELLIRLRKKYPCGE